MAGGKETATPCRFNVAMAGLGYFGRYQLNAWERIGETTVTAIAEPSDKARRRISQEMRANVFPDPGTMLADAAYDILDIATPPATHAAILREAIGKVPMIICQKPFCTSLGDAEEMVELAQKAGTCLIVHENFRFMPWYRVFRQKIDAGRLGTVRQAHFRFRPGDGEGEEAYQARQPYFRSMERFLVHETGIHWIDVFRYLFGEPASVFADLWKSNPKIAGEDSGYLVFEFEDGLRAVLDANRTLDHAADNPRLTMGEFIVEGSDGSLSLNGFGDIEFRKTGEKKSVKVVYHFEDRDFGADCVYHFQRHVVDYLISGAPLETTADAYLANLRIEEAVYRSAEQGVRVSLR